MSTGKGTDQAYLLNEQYRDSTNLRARIHLHRQYSTNTYGWTRWVFDYIKLSPPDAQILEIGCGPCDLWLQNLERIPDDWAIFLSDLSPGMIEKGQNLLFDRAQRFTFQNFDAQDIPHDDNSLDTVIANHMLYHVPHLDRGLAEIQRVLKPTGRLYAATNGANHMKEMRALRQQFLNLIGPSGNHGSPSGNTSTVDTQSSGAELSHGNAPTPDNQQADFDNRGHTRAGSEQWGLQFSLENGEELLRSFFPRLNLRHYVDSLRVTSARPLYDYMMSSRVHSVPREFSAAFLDFLQAELDAAGGVITIEKETGMFEAWEEDPPIPESKHTFSFVEDDPDIKLLEAPREINLGDDAEVDHGDNEVDDDESTKVQNLQLDKRS